MDWCHIFSIKVQIVLFNFCFICCYLMFFFKMDIKFRMQVRFVVFVVVVWFCSSSRLAFIIMADLISLMRFFYSNEVLALESIFFFIHRFFVKTLIFWGFSSCSFGSQLFQKCEWVAGTLCTNAHYRASLFTLFLLCFYFTMLLFNTKDMPRILQISAQTPWSEDLLHRLCVEH